MGICILFKIRKAPLWFDAMIVLMLVVMNASLLYLVYYYTMVGRLSIKAVPDGPRAELCTGRVAAPNGLANARHSGNNT
jgi:hypothetical protein